MRTSKKEAVIREHFELLKKARENNLQGVYTNQPIGHIDDFDAYVVRYHRAFTKLTLAELEYQRDRLINMYDEALRKQKRQNFLDSDEGQRVQANIEASKKALIASYIERFNEKFDILDDVIRKRYPGFCLESIGHCSVTIGLFIESRIVHELHSNKCLFGHSISVYYRPEKDSIEANFGTMGNFDLVNDTKYVSFVHMIGQLVVDTELHQIIKSALCEFKALQDTHFSSIDALDKDIDSYIK